MTHYHCENPKEYPQEIFDSVGFSAWDTLREFSDTCKDHQFKDNSNVL